MIVFQNENVNRSAKYPEKYQACLQRLIKNKGQLVPRGVNIFPYIAIVIDSINEVNVSAKQPIKVSFNYIGYFGIPSNTVGTVNCSENDYLFN